MQDIDEASLDELKQGWLPVYELWDQATCISRLKSNKIVQKDTGSHSLSMIGFPRMSVWWFKKNLTNIRDGHYYLMVCGWHLRTSRILFCLPKVMAGLPGEENRGHCITWRHLATKSMQALSHSPAWHPPPCRLLQARPFSTFPFIKQETQMLVIRRPSPAAKSHSVPKSPVYCYLCVC